MGGGSLKVMHVLIVDDELLARRALLLELERRPDVASVTEASDGLEAVRLLCEGSFDLVFLDVRMPEVDGFEVLRRVGVERMPPVVFVTAHDEFAVEAFEVRALDYLLKPFTRARFDAALRRALEAHRKGPTHDSEPPGARTHDLEGLLRENAAAGAPDQLHIKVAGRTTVVPLEEVLWIEAANSYVRVHTREQTHLLRASISHLEEQLDPARFLRVHRSTIVALDRIVELRHVVRGDYELVLQGGTVVRASRRRRAALFERLQHRKL